jgi:putative oxidoreductase
MKFVATTARYLLGLLFTVMGLNGFLHFIPMGPMPPLAGQFFGALVESHYMAIIFALQIAAGLLLLATPYLALAVAILAPIVVNIDLVHIFMAPAGLPLAAVVTLLWGVLAYRVRSAFFPLFKPLQTVAISQTASAMPRVSAPNLR